MKSWLLIFFYVFLGLNSLAWSDSSECNPEKSIACNARPIPRISVDPIVLKNKSVNFSSLNSSDSDGTIISSEWSFGDGSSSILPEPSHSYKKAGLYKVSLKITDNEGSFTTEVKQIFVSDIHLNNAEVEDYRPYDNILLKIRNLNESSKLRCFLNDLSPCSAVKTLPKHILIALPLLSPSEYTVGLMIDKKFYSYSFKVKSKFESNSPESDFEIIRDYIDFILNQNNLSEKERSYLLSLRYNFLKGINGLSQEDRNDVVGYLINNMSFNNLKKMRVDKNQYIDETTVQSISFLYSSSCLLDRSARIGIAGLVSIALYLKGHPVSATLSAVAAIYLFHSAKICSAMLDEHISNIKIIEDIREVQKETRLFTSGERVTFDLVGTYRNINQEDVANEGFGLGAVADIVKSALFYKDLHRRLFSFTPWSFYDLTNVPRIEIGAVIDPQRISKVSYVPSPEHRFPVYVIPPYISQNRSSLLFHTRIGKNFNYAITYNLPQLITRTKGFNGYIDGHNGVWVSCAIYPAQNRTDLTCHRPGTPDPFPTSCNWNIGGVKYSGTHISLNRLPGFRSISISTSGPNNDFGNLQGQINLETCASIF